MYLNALNSLMSRLCCVCDTFCYDAFYFGFIEYVFVRRQGILGCGFSTMFCLKFSLKSFFALTSHLQYL